MPQVIRTDQAEADLVDILAYVARRSQQAADQLAAAIEQQCQQLARFPGIGRDRGDLAPGLRSFVVQRYLIFFRPIDGGIEVVRVIHGARKIDRHCSSRSAAVPPPTPS
jgi:toxin ParE1/3/4